MALVLFHTKRVRQALERRADLGTDVLLIAGIAGLIAGVAMVFGQFRSNLPPGGITIDLSFAALPKYTLFSLARGFAAYALSLVFTLVYGTVAAHNHKAEKVMLPALDILQSIPVLGFLPGLVLAMVRLFPGRSLGLEISCIVMIFTAQVWNMTFSFHGSLRGIPTALREVAAVQRLTGWQIFRLLEVPAAMIGLVWNSMMSMAGGWFFLTVNEAFTLGGQDYRLPGIGSYMSQAIAEKNVPAMLAAIVAMVTMIVAVDQLFWRPIVVWAQRFKLEDSAGNDAPSSWMVNLFKRSRLLAMLRRWMAHRRAERELRDAPAFVAASATEARDFAGVRKWLARAVVAALALLAVWGGYRLLRLMIALPLVDHGTADWVARPDWATVLLALLASFGRTTSAVLLGAAWTLPVGILIGLSPRWSQRLQPVIQVLASFPAPMLFPLVFFLLVKLHVNFQVGCTVLMLLGAQWYILFNVIAGATAIPAELKEAAAVYHLSRRQKWLRLYLPSVFPFLVTGLVTAAGGAWNATIVSEYLTVGDPSDPANTHTAFGLGSKITAATVLGDYRMLAASVVVMALFVVMINRVVWKRLYRLAEGRYSLNV